MDRRWKVSAFAEPCHVRQSIPATLLQPLLRAEAKFPVKLATRVFSVDEVAEPTAYTALTTIQPAACFSEIGSTLLAFLRPFDLVY
jgi:hypothetical protein